MKPNDYQNIIAKIRELLCQKDSVIIAIDGRCASGKTTLAKQLQEEFGCNVIHMDDFYLPLEKRDFDWQQSPAKNIDFPSLLNVFDNIKTQTEYQFSPYSCHTGSYEKTLTFQKNSITVIEGSYSCHPNLYNHYDFRIFLNISSDEQNKRILTRNGEEGYARFQKIWIPLEETYFKQYDIRNQCDLVINHE